MTIEQPCLASNGELRIPRDAPQRYKWWAGGQSLWQTLAEIKAPLKTWKLYAYQGADLLTDEHKSRCSGEVGQAADCVYCVTCGRYAEKGINDDG